MRYISAFVINMERDRDRYDRLERELSAYDFTRTYRVPGVQGSALPDQLCLKLTNDPNSLKTKGAVGCFLSHVRAWEKVAASETSASVILEDDAILQNWELLSSIDFPQDFDVIFANNRVSGFSADISLVEFHEVEKSLTFIDHHGKAVGGDCYILSKRGAGRLLDRCRVDGYFGHVDIRILAYSLSYEKIDVLPEYSWVKGAVQRVFKVCNGENVVKAYSLTPSLCLHIVNGETSRTREDSLGIM